MQKPPHLWVLRMAAHARDRRADLDLRLRELRTRALAAFDEGRECLATVRVRIDRHGEARHEVAMMDGTTPADVRRAA